MPQGCQTLPEIQWTVVQLSRFLDHKQIGMGVDLSIQMVKCILSHYCDYGTIPNPGSDAVVKKEQKGGQHLCDVHLEVRSLPAYMYQCIMLMLL